MVEQGMLVWWSIEAGVHVEPHTHANEQIVWMLKDKMEFRLGSEQQVCGPGDIVVIPGGAEHEGWFREDSEVIDLAMRRSLLIHCPSVRSPTARSLELRAATDLTRLWMDQGKHAEARAVLSSIYGSFTEGFDTRDLNEAKAVLAQL